MNQEAIPNVIEGGVWVKTCLFTRNDISIHLSKGRHYSRFGG